MASGLDVEVPGERMLTDEEASELAALQQRQFAEATGSLDRAELRRMNTLLEARASAMPADAGDVGADDLDATEEATTAAAPAHANVSRRPSVPRRVLVLTAACLAVLALAAGAFVLGGATRPDGLITAGSTVLAQRIEAEQGWDAGSTVFAGTIHRRDIFMGTRGGGASDCAVVVRGERIGAPECVPNTAFIELPDAAEVSERGLTYGVAAARGDDGQPTLLSVRVIRGSTNIPTDVPDMPEDQMLASAERARANVATVAGGDGAQLEPAGATSAYVIWIYDSRCVVVDVLDTAPSEALTKIEREGLRTRSLCLDEPSSETSAGVLGIDNSGSDALLMILPGYITAEMHGPGRTTLSFQSTVEWR